KEVQELHLENTERALCSVASELPEATDQTRETLAAAAPCSAGHQQKAQHTRTINDASRKSKCQAPHEGDLRGGGGSVESVEMATDCSGAKKLVGVPV
ncbi:hypothetical protein D4764_16G0002710, partial [Takifugu flavidus]